MIKEFKDITQKDLEYMKKHKVTVTEKLDLIYFKVMLSEDNITVLTSKNKPINKIDCIVNSVYKNIVDFVSNTIIPKHLKIYNTLGNCEIGFFYKPVPKTYTITYNYIENDFIIGNLYTEKKQNNNVEFLADLLSNVSVLTPICIKECICKFEDINDSKSIIRNLTGGETWSGNSIDEIEGVILSSGKLNYKISVNNVDPDIEKTTKKLYRDTILENFCNVVFDSDDAKMILDTDADYIDKVCGLFMEYINKTNIFTRLDITPEDLLPPNAGYIGDIDYSCLPPTIKIVCKNNDIYKNILRILLVTFNRSIFENKFKTFRDDTRSKLTEILAKINS